MATYTQKYCPHCNRMYQNYSTHTKKMTVKNGCPIVTCPYCRKMFLDKDIKEPAFEKQGDSLGVLGMVIALSFSFWMFILAGVVLIAAAVEYHSWLAALISLFPWSLYFYVLYTGVKNRKKINKDLNDGYEESKERLSDKKYVILLIELGYPVPKKFLRENYPDLINYKKNKNN